LEKKTFISGHDVVAWLRWPKGASARVKNYYLWPRGSISGPEIINFFTSTDPTGHRTWLSR